MATLTADRNTLERTGDYRYGPVGADELIHAGAIVMRDATGHLVAGQTATGLIGVGRANGRANNSGGSNGDLALTYKVGTFRYENSAAADAITAAEIGGIAWAVDDQTVAKTNGSASRSPAGIIEDVDANGVWVRFDEALTNAAAA